MNNSVDVADGALLRITGPEDAPALMLLHCFADTGHCFAGICHGELSRRFRLIAPDLWGHGASPRRADVGTVVDYARALEGLIDRYMPARPIGLVGHSIASAIAVELAARLGERAAGLFSIEGNLIADDAFFTGKAADYDDPDVFKRSFLDQLWELGQASETLRHYHAGAVVADARTLWDLGRDAKRISEGDRLGQSYRAMSQPSLYYWSKESTPSPTREWIETSGIAHQTYTGTSHWPMIDQPEATADSMGRFFDTVLA